MKDFFLARGDYVRLCGGSYYIGKILRFKNRGEYIDEPTIECEFSRDNEETYPPIWRKTSFQALREAFSTPKIGYKAPINPSTSRYCTNVAQLLEINHD